MATTTARNAWHHTMLRIKDPAVSVPFYSTHFDMQLVAQIPQSASTDYFLASKCLVPSGWPAPETVDLPKLLEFPYTTLKLSHTHGTEKDDSFAVESGNKEPIRGFGHIAVTCEDVYAGCDALIAAGVGFQKKPDDGKMKGLAFALDPDGYWIEIIRRDPTEGLTGYLLNQTMIRVKDPKKTLGTYRDALGMTVVCERHFEQWKFSLYFLAYVPEGVTVPEDTDAGMGLTKVLKNPILELTHNHGTEDKEGPAYHAGAPIGMDHLGFVSSDVAGTVTAMEAAGCSVVTPAADGKPALCADPDGYHVYVYPEGAAAGK